MSTAVKEKGYDELMREEAARSNPVSHLGSQYKREFREVLQEAAQRDPVAKLAVERVKQLEDKARSYASGQRNQRRGVLQQELNEAYHKAAMEIADARRETADALNEQIGARAKSIRTQASDTKSLRQLTEARMQAEAMSTEELESRAFNVVNQKSDATAALLFAHRADYDAIRAELRKRGKGERADELSKRLERIPADALGDREAAKLIQEQRFYAAKAETGTVPVAGNVWVPLEYAIEAPDLSNVPA